MSFSIICFMFYGVILDTTFGVSYPCDSISAATTAYKCTDSKGVGTGQCIHSYQICNGENDCSDGYDEEWCCTEDDKPTYFDCDYSPDNTCLYYGKVCNGKVECDDGFDEEYCLRYDGINAAHSDGESKPMPQLKLKDNGVGDEQDGTDTIKIVICLSVAFLMILFIVIGVIWYCKRRKTKTQITELNA
eukprot:178545_1